MSISARTFLFFILVTIPATTSWGLTRDDVLANSVPFRDLRWSSKNSINACSSPTWIRTPHAANSTITGMAYNWGGNSTLSEFTSAIAASGYPGNRCTSSDGNKLGLRPNTWGVDCSGFFGRIFGISQKLDTTTIRNMTVPVRNDRYGLRYADVLVKSGSHVAIYLAGTPTGAPSVIESVGTYWRVVERTAKWSEFQGYESRRWAQLQDAGIAKIESATVPTFRQGSKLVLDLTLRETDGNNIRYDGLGFAIFDDAMTNVLGYWTASSSFSFLGDERRRFAISALTGLPAGTYRLLPIGKVGTRWSYLLPTPPAASSTRFTVTR